MIYDATRNLRAVYNQSYLPSKVASSAVRNHRKCCLRPPHIPSLYHPEIPKLIHVPPSQHRLGLVSTIGVRDEEFRARARRPRWKNSIGCIPSVLDIRTVLGPSNPSTSCKTVDGTCCTTVVAFSCKPHKDKGADVGSKSMDPPPVLRARPYHHHTLRADNVVRCAGLVDLAVVVWWIDDGDDDVGDDDDTCAADLLLMMFPYWKTM
eukprot:scaffold1356_cov123-Cylindrotheca_fusiformis.AAC.48